MRMKNITLLFIVVPFFISSCSDDQDGELEQLKTSFQILGKVEKGPFVHGSGIVLSVLDETFSQIGESYTERIETDEGDFDFGELELASSYVELTANGYFFNECTGQLSKGPISLDALADVSKQQNVNVNILTHLKKDRVLTLIKQKKSFEAANYQAQRELLSCFGLQRFADNDVSTFSMGYGTDEAAALIVISSVLLGQRSEAELTEYLARLREEFKNNGTFSDDVKNDILEASRGLDFEFIRNNVISRYQSIGKAVNVKKLDYFVDWNGDGIAGNELGDPNQDRVLQFETDTLYVSAEGGIYEVGINANIPYAEILSLLIDGPDGPLEPEQFFLLKTGNISFSSSFNNGMLVLNVEPASSRVMNETTFLISSMDGKTIDTLVVVQEGDTSRPLEFTSDGIAVIESFLSRGVEAMNNFHLLDGLYTQSFLPENGSFEWQQIYDHNLTPASSILSDTWNSGYRVIPYLRQLKKYIPENSSLYSSFVVLESLFYYEMAVLYGNIVYIISDDVNGGMSNPQLTKDELFLKLVEGLQKEIRHLPGFVYGSFDETQPSSYFPCTIDVANVILAKIYLEHEEFDNAYYLLQEIIHSGNYDLSESRKETLSKGSREVIYAFRQDPESIYNQYIEATDLVPVLLYSEVVMLAAECAYNLDKDAEAIAHFNLLAESRGVATISSTTDFMSDMMTMWQSELKGTGTYFAFLKRNNLAEEALNIPSYKTLLPIPQQEIDLGYNLNQNPGY